MRGWEVARSTAGFACAAGLLAACSSGDSSSATAAAGSASVLTAGASANAQIACSRFYDFDLQLRTSTANTSMDDTAKAKAWRALRQSSNDVVSAVSSAVVIAALPPAAQSSAERIDRILGTIRKAGGDLRDVKAAAAAKIARRSAVIESACVAAGVPVPQANLDAR